MSYDEAPDPNRPFFADLESDEWAVVHDALQRASAWLRLGEGTEEEVSEVAAYFVELARHPEWQVRRALARALEHLKHPSFQLAIAPLLEDDTHAVRLGAQRSLDRWTSKAHSDVLTEQHGHRLDLWLGDIEAHHGKRTRQAAIRLAQRYAELLVIEAKHEFEKFFEAMHTSVIRLRTEVSNEHPDRMVLDEGLRLHHQTIKVMRTVVDALQDFTDTRHVPFGVHPLRPIVEEAVGVVRDQAGPGDELIAVDIGIDPGLCIESARTRLVQAFVNLAQNAVESYAGMQGPRRLAVAARVEGTRVVLTFADRGCGIPEDFKPHAFKLFKTTKPTGTGFGLPLVMKIIENEHQGAVRLDSTQGKGTTVTVVLPIEHKEARG